MSTSPPPLDAGRARLRPLALTDAPALHVAYADPEVCHFWSRAAYTRLAETEEAVAWEIAHGTSWAILDAASGGDGGDAVGRVSLFPGRSAGVLEVGIILARAAWGRGLAQGALAAVVAYGFDALAAHRIFADIDPDNARSLRLFERAGFAREGLLPQAWRTHLGLRDTVILGRLAGARPADARELVTRYLREAWNQRRLEVADELVAPDYDAGIPNVRGPAAARALVRAFDAAFPDFAIAIDDVVAEGDRVAVRYQFAGTHRGPWMGVAPTGARASIAGQTIYQLASGRIARTWFSYDALGLLRQLAGAGAPIP